MVSFKPGANRQILISGFALMLAACETPGYYDDGDEDLYGNGNYGNTGQSISIPYDPYNFDADELLKSAQSHCNAYGLNAVYVDETIDPQSVRWRYRHFSCV